MPKPISSSSLIITAIIGFLIFAALVADLGGTPLKEWVDLAHLKQGLYCLNKGLWNQTWEHLRQALTIGKYTFGMMLFLIILGVVRFIHESKIPTPVRSEDVSSGKDTRLQKHLVEQLGKKIFNQAPYPIELVDQKVEDEIEKIRKARFFVEFDSFKSSLVLGNRLLERGIFQGSDEIRGRALAWCARFLARSEEVDQAGEFLALAKTIGDSPETKIAEAFIISQKGDKAAALKTLAGVGSPASRTAGLMIVAHHDSSNGAIKWMTDAGFEVEDLDSDGKFILLLNQLELSNWDAGTQILTALNDADYQKTPILHHFAAVTKLLSAVPIEFRPVVLKQVPFDASGFPLASDAVAMDARCEAHGRFLDAVDAARQLSCHSTAKSDDLYALWLELMDPAKATNGRNRLKEQLRDPKLALGLVHFALQFGLKLDWNAVERDIEQQIAINGGMTTEAATARYALVFKQKTPEDAANYIAQYYDQLAAHIDTQLMRLRQIELLSRSGLGQKANDRLDRFISQGISAEEEAYLRGVITQAVGSDPIEALKAQYKATKDLSDLTNLVNELEIRRQWDGVCEYGAKLFECTHSLLDAERLVNAFNNTQKSGPLVEFLILNADLISQSKILQMSYAWGLYNEGSLIESRTALAELKDNSEDQNYRTLHVNLIIATGDWPSLSTYIANEYQNRENRNAYELMGAAQLASHLDLPHARDLITATAEKAGDDAGLLAGAYFLATSMGWEDDESVFQWLERAAELSGDDGPIQRKVLKDVFEHKQDWDRRESEAWRLLGKGEIPIFLASQSLNRSHVSLTIFLALANLSETDPRRRAAIPAYSGTRIPKQLDIAGSTIAIEANALLTLSFLKILDKSLDAFKTAYIPHSTLTWLFGERQKTAFHQPSRIKNAHQVRHLLATDMLEKYDPSTDSSSDLATQVGDELAALIAEAEKVREDDNTQRIVVRSSPVHRLSTFMEEEADLSSHAPVLSSCLAVVKKLRQKGQITAEEEKRAGAYLQLLEKPWPDQPEISDGAMLYLDSLAITYLLHMGMLGRIKTAGLRALASPKKISEANDLISYEGISEEVNEAIEHIRVVLSSRIESGQVRVGRRPSFDEVGEKPTSEHPTFEIIAMAPYCDAAIVDDRLLNQHEKLSDSSKAATIYSTLDLLDALASTDVISKDDHLEYRTKLRRGGYFFVPVSEGELDRYLTASAVVDGSLVETAELKAVRESVLRVRMCDWLQLPKELPWLNEILKAYIRVLKSLWVDGTDVAECVARSNWIADQLDIRGWAHSFGPDRGDNVIRIGRGPLILLFLMPPLEAKQDIVSAYWNWLEERILSPIKEYFPDLYTWLLDSQRRQVSEMAETKVAKGDAP